MDVRLFTEFKTGKIVDTTFLEQPDHAFLPNPLPPPHSIIATKLWPLITQANKRVERLNGVAQQFPDAGLLLRPLQRREALTSNSLEGTFVTPQELLLFEADKKQGHGVRRDDWLEVAHYDIALQKGCRHIQQGHALDCVLICHLHRMLLQGTRGHTKDPGKIRDTQVVVGVDRRYVPPPPSELASLLKNFEEYVCQNTDLDPLVRAYVTHYQFEAIHPFKDGNGRIGRLLLSLAMYKWLDLSSPWLYMSEFFERNRKDYIACLFRVSSNGEWEEWLDFCLKGTIEQADSSIARCLALQRLKQSYSGVLADAPLRAVKIMEQLFSSPFITVGEVQQSFKVSYGPARKYIDRLLAAGIVHAMENRYPKTFVAREIFRIAYGDVV